MPTIRKLRSICALSAAVHVLGALLLLLSWRLTASEFLPAAVLALLAALYFCLRWQSGRFGEALGPLLSALDYSVFALGLLLVALVWLRDAAVVWGACGLFCLLVPAVALLLKRRAS